jgi:hypothetical protein
MEHNMDSARYLHRVSQKPLPPASAHFFKISAGVDLGLNSGFDFQEIMPDNHLLDVKKF